MGLLTPMPISSTSLPAERAVLRAEEAAALDDEVELARYTTFAKLDGGAQEACSRLVLDGLHCAACASLIEQALHRVDGVLDAQVQAASRRAQVRWDPARTKASSLIEAIQRAGYKAFPDTATQQRAKETLESRRAVWRLFAAGFCMMQVMMYATPMYVAAPGDIGPDIIQLLRWASWLLSLPVVLFAATPFYTGAWRALRHGRIGMDVPIALGVLVTFIASTGATFDTIAPGQTSAWGREVYFDSLTMFVTFLLIGRALEQRARRRAAEALESVLHRLPESVERVLGDQTELVAPARLRVGDAVRVSAGQAFPADGVLVQGHTQVDEALLTGESRPVDRDTGSLVMAGSHNLVNPVVMRVERLGGRHPLRAHRGADAESDVRASVVGALGRPDRRAVPVGCALAGGGCGGCLDVHRPGSCDLDRGVGADRHLPVRLVAGRALGHGGRCRRLGAPRGAGAAV